MQDIPNRALDHAETSGQFVLGPSLGIQFPHVLGSLKIRFVADKHSLFSRYPFKRASSLVSHILHVFLVGSGCKVFGVLAKLIMLSGALVKYPKTFWEWAIMQYPRHLMCSHWFRAFTPSAHLAMTKNGSGAGPRPTRIWPSRFINFRFPSFLGASGKSLRSQVFGSNGRRYGSGFRHNVSFYCAKPRSFILAGSTL